MNQFNTIHGDEPAEPQIKCNIQPPAVNFKSCNHTSKIGPVVLALVGRFNNHAFDNVNVDVYPSYYSL